MLSAFIPSAAAFGQTRLRQPGEAVTLQELAHKIPKSARKEFERAKKAGSNKDTLSAIEHLSKATEMDCEFWAALNDLGAYLILAQHTEEGIEALRKAIRVNPQAALSYANLAHGLLVSKGTTTRSLRREQPFV